MAIDTQKPVASTPILSITYGSALVLIFLGERLMGGGGAATGFTVVGATLALLALVLKAVAMGKQPVHTRGPEKSLVLLYGIGCAALLSYFATSDLWFHLTGYTLAKQSPRLAAAFSTLWPALLILGTLPVLFVEMSLAGMARAPVRDVARARAAMFSGLGIGLALVFCFSFAFVASERDKKADLSYFRVARAGESTLKVIENLDKPVEITLFFPPANEVLVEVEAYFEELKQRSPQLKVEVVDHAVDPARAREMGVSGNGAIVIGREKLREQIGLPVTILKARDALRKLDGEVHKRLLGVTRPPRVAYLTQGHGERRIEPSDETDRRGSVRLIREFLLDQGYEVKDLGLAEGLGTDVPADASIVLIVGPTSPFLPEEIGAISRFAERQGRLLIALDPEANLAYENLLDPFSVSFRPTQLAHDELFARRTRTTADRANLFAASYASHVSVTTLSKMGRGLPAVFPGVGYLELKSGVDSLTTVRFTVHADSKTWADRDNNFEHNTSDEVRKSYELAAAISKRTASAVLPEEESRVIVIADSDFLTDGIIQHRPNAALFIDAIRWLGGEDAIAGSINNEEDVPVTHTRKQDVMWFYSSVFVAPVLVLGIGMTLTRTRKRRTTKPTAVRPTGDDGASTTEAQP